MFGTLAPIDFERGTLEFIENPDPAAATSRNFQDKIRIACNFCRSRKARCSGEWKTCQRCEAMGLQCVYSDDQGQSKRQENRQNRRGVARRSTNHSISASIRTVREEPEPITRDIQTKENDQSASGDGLNFSMFDDNCIDKALESPWNMDTPMQHSIDGSSSSRSNPTPNNSLATSESFTSPPSTRSSTAAFSAQLSEPLMPDTCSTSLLISLGDMDSWKETQTVQGNMAWTLNTDRHDWMDPTSEPLCIKQAWGGKANPGPDSCGCLLKSISFLERLTSKSASRENRIDRLLADVRNAMETLAIFLACELCASRVEQSMLLAMAARQLSIICRKTADCFKALKLCGLGDQNSTRHKPEFDVSGSPIDISISTYRVSQREGLHLLESLVAIQIVDLQHHINTIKSQLRNQPNQEQAEAVIEAENNTKLAQAALSSHN